MKRLLRIVGFLGISLSLGSCLGAIESGTVSTKEKYFEKKDILTKTLETRLSHGVTRTDVEDYLEYRLNVSLASVKDITRYDISNNAYIFIVNLNDGGWYLFSGDYSSMPVLAFGEQGSLYYGEREEMSPHRKMFLNTVRDYITHNQIRGSDSNKTNQSNWISALLKASLVGNQTRKSEGDDFETSIETITDTLIWDYYPGLIQTSWDQIFPFNEAMPKRYTTNLRCPAGCTVIAIAQLLYYTHMTFGFPNDTYSSAYCNDYYDEGPAYDFHLSGQTTSVWDLMETEYDSEQVFGPYVPALCALVAERSSTVYSVIDPLSPIDDGGAYGETNVNNIAGTLASFMLTGATNLPFDKTTVTNEIAHDRPVLCGGSDSPNTSVGHAFLFDGYIWRKTKTTEIIKDDQGVEIDRNEYYTESFYWHVNTGEPYAANHGWVYDDVYCPYNRIMFTGWCQ